MELITVTGLVSIDALQLADGHEHVWIDPPLGVAADARITLNDPVRIEQELASFRESGGSLLVDCQPGGAGRDSRRLRQLSAATGVHVTATTGFHQRKYYPSDDWLWNRASVEDACALFVDELTVGTQESRQTTEGPPILAAVLKVGYEGTFVGRECVLMEAVAEASRQTGAAVLFHTEQGRNVEALIPYFERLGVPAARLYICHVDKRPDLGLHRELAQAGALLGYDTFTRPKYDPDQNAWRLLHALVAEGLSHSVAIGLDLAFSSSWRSFGGEPGLCFLPDSLVPRLRLEGFDDPAIRQLTAQNVAQRLVWQTSN